MRLLHQALTFALMGGPPGAVIDVRRAGKALQVQLAATVDAPLVQVERVLMEVQYWPHWIPHLRSTRVLEADAGHIVLATEIDLPWPVSDVNETVRIDR